MKGNDIYMESIQKYYENTENALPNPTVRKFIEMNIKPQDAIELGCGAGRDTTFLIKNGWKVLAVDKENTKDIILGNLNEEEKMRFTFSCQNFEDIKLEKTNLLVSNFSIPFCNKKKFDGFWRIIKDSILSGRIFCWKLFWTK